MKTEEEKTEEEKTEDVNAQSAAHGSAEDRNKAPNLIGCQSELKTITPRMAIRILQVAGAEAYPNEPPLAYSSKSASQLKTFLRKMRDAGYTAAQIEDALYAVAIAWGHFRAQVRQRMGRKLPERLQTLWLPSLFEEVCIFIPAGWPPNHGDDPTNPPPSLEEWYENLDDLHEYEDY